MTGGASFIGSHLVDALVGKGAAVRAVDDLSSGERHNLKGHLEHGAVELIEADLREPGVTRNAMHGVEVVFHLAADHGGRGYVDLRQAGPASNLFLDGLVFWEARRARVEHVVFASSGCVYPNFLQSDPRQEVYLGEELVKPPYDSDNMYGYAKLMGELTLKAYAAEYGLKTASCRYFTVYGPRAKENHAVMAMIARAFVGQDPFDVGEGATRDADPLSFTKIRVGQHRQPRSGDSLNRLDLGIGHQGRLVPALSEHADEASRLAHLEVGRLVRAGVERTIEWYRTTKRKEDVRRVLAGGGLIERRIAV